VNKWLKVLEFEKTVLLQRKNLKEIRDGCTEQDTWEIGQKLKEVIKWLKHGQFENLLKLSSGWEPRTACLYQSARSLLANLQIFARNRYCYVRTLPPP